MEIPIITLATEPRDSKGLFPNFQDHMYLGGQVRMEAAVRLAQDNELILAGGYNQQDDIYASDKVEDMRAFVQEQVPDARLTPIPSLPCTHHNFVAVFNALRQAGRSLDWVGILTNRYHLPRAVEFARRSWARLGRPAALAITEFAAEDILGVDIVEVVQGSEYEYAARVASESRGLLHLKQGKYREKCLTDRLERLRLIIQKHPDILLTPDERLALSAPN